MKGYLNMKKKRKSTEVQAFSELRMHNATN